MKRVTHEIITARIAEQARRERRAANTILTILELNHNEYSSAFFPGKKPEEVNEVELFDAVDQSFRGIVDEVKAGGTVTHSYEKPGDEAGAEDPLVKLGIVKYVATVGLRGNPEVSTVPHVRRITEEGLPTINGWLRQFAEVNLDIPTASSPQAENVA